MPTQDSTPLPSQPRIRSARSPRRSGRTGILALALLGVLLSSGCQRSSRAVYLSGERAYAEGDYSLAAAEFEEYLDRVPGNPQVTQKLGESYLKLDRTAEARERLLVAYSMRPEDDEVFDSLCQGLFADQKFEELNRVLRQRAIDRGRMSDYLLLSQYSDKMGDADEAQRALLTAAKVDRGMSIQPQIELAKFYLRTGDRQRAVERLRMAYAIDPNDGEVLGLSAQLGEIIGPTWALTPAER